MKIAGCVGRIRHQKGTDLFVDAMIRLLPDRPDWIGIIAGRTTAEHTGFEKELRQRIADAGLTDRIRFVGEHIAQGPDVSGFVFSLLGVVVVSFGAVLAAEPYTFISVLGIVWILCGMATVYTGLYTPRYPLLARFLPTVI